MYKLQDVCQLVTDLQTRVNDQHESAVVRQARRNLWQYQLLSKLCHV